MLALSDLGNGCLNLYGHVDHTKHKQTVQTGDWTYVNMHV